MKIEIFPSRSALGFCWRIRAKNGQILATSEVYASRRNAKKTATRVAKALGATVREVWA